jgi:uncharacterized membrane protein
VAGHATTTATATDAPRILQDRFARGGIDAEEYRQRREQLPR